MSASRNILVACCLIVAPVVLQAQRNVIAAGNGALLSNDFDFSIGRELLSPTRTVGLRVSLDYARDQVRREAFRYDFSDPGFVSRPYTYEWHSRRAGMRFSAHYSPFRWVVRPYVTLGVGLHDSYTFGRLGAVDSATINGVTWPAIPERIGVRSQLLTSFERGIGISSRLGRFGAFAEVRMRNEYAGARRVHFSESLPISFGIRF